MGVYLNSQLSFKQHITHKCKVAMLNIHRIRNIRSTLTTEATHTLRFGYIWIFATVYCLAYQKIQSRNCRVQNIATKLVLNRTKHESSAESRKQLHWLPIAARIEFKIIVLVYKCLHGNAQEYLQKILTPKPVLREGLRSSTFTNNLHVPKTSRHTFASRSFSVSGPSLWNELPYNIKECTNLKRFRKEVKTHLFKKYYR